MGRLPGRAAAHTTREKMRTKKTQRQERRGYGPTLLLSLSLSLSLVDGGPARPADLPTAGTDAIKRDVRGAAKHRRSVCGFYAHSPPRPMDWNDADMVPLRAGCRGAAGAAPGAPAVASTREEQGENGEGERRVGRSAAAARCLERRRHPPGPWDVLRPLPRSMFARGRCLRCRRHER